MEAASLYLTPYTSTRQREGNFECECEEWQVDGTWNMIHANEQVQGEGRCQGDHCEVKGEGLRGCRWGR